MPLFAISRSSSDTTSRRRLLGAFVAISVGLSAAEADAAQASAIQTLAILPIRILDTSGEARDQTADHAARLAAMAEALSARLGTGKSRRVVAVTPEALTSACPEPSTPCILAAARDRGAGLAFVGVVHKSSTLIMQMFARVVDASSGATLFTSDLNFRGDTDESWQRMTDFLAREIEEDAAVGN